MYNNNYGGGYVPNTGYNYRPNLNGNYAQRLNTLEQQYYQQQQPQPIQNMVPTQPQATCYFVTAPEDMNKINVMPDTVYLGINQKDKELYIRQLNNNGIVEFETYTKSAAVEEKNDYKLILEQLTEINEKLGRKEKRDESDVSRNSKTDDKSSNSRAF